MEKRGKSGSLLDIDSLFAQLSRELDELDAFVSRSGI
jgi:hypothetical protein